MRKRQFVLSPYFGWTLSVVCRIHISSKNTGAEPIHDALIFDDISKIIAKPRSGWRRMAFAVAVEYGGKLVAGLVMGLGFAIGLALTG